VYLVTGLSGVGLTLGTASGELIASLIEHDDHPLAETNLRETDANGPAPGMES